MFYRFDALVIRTEKNRKLASTDQTKTLCYPSIGKFYTRGLVCRVRASLEASNASIMEADMHSFYSAIFLYVDLEAIRTHKTTEAEVRKTISSFLKYAPDRCGGAGRSIKENNS